MCLQPKNLKFDWKAALPVVDFHPRMLFSIEKILFCGWPTLVWSHLFSKLTGSNYKNHLCHAGQAKRKVNCDELSVELTLLRLPHIVKAIAKFACKSEFHPCAVFSTRALLRVGRYAKGEFRALQQQQEST